MISKSRLKKLEKKAQVYDNIKAIFKNNKCTPYTNPLARSSIATALSNAPALSYSLAVTFFSYSINTLVI